MSSNFDWRAEDDISWDEYATGPDGEQPEPKKKRPLWLIAVVVLAVILSSGYFAFRQVRRYVENTAASVEEDVLSSHALVKLAAQEGDLELFAPLLSGRDPNWTQDQLAILEMGLLFDRKPFGLSWKPEATSKDISVDLSNDLQAAEVEYVESYAYGLNGEEGVVQLTQTAVYRLSETRWLLSPPDDDFWGNWISSRGRYVVLTFPERDSEIGRQLASDLEAVIAGACTSLELDCGDNQPLDVLLETDLDAVMAISNPEHFAQEGGQLVLPTPTLIGKPANSASYRVLYRGYATYLVSRLIAQQAEWECCGQSPFFKAMVDVQLHQLGIQTWPLTAADYRLALRQPLDIEDVRAIRNDELSLAEFQELPDWQVLYLFVEYVVSREDAPPVIEIERTLARTASFNAWITQAGITGSLNLAEDDWENAVYRRILARQGQPPVSLPEEDLALICYDGQTGIANVYRYDPNQNLWTIELADRDFVVMSGLPNNEGLMLTEQYLDVDQFRTTLYRDGQEVAVDFGSAFIYSSGFSDSSGRYLVLNSFQQPENTGDFIFTIYLLDLESCTNDNCSLIEIEGLPIWSPDRSHTLWVQRDFTDSNQGQDLLYLGDDKSQSGEPIETGRNPFWLDNENFAYLQGAQDVILMKSTTSDSTSEQLLEVSDLAALIPDLEESDIAISSATADPAIEDLIFVTAANRIENKDYLFSLNLRTGEIKLILSIEDSPGGLGLLASRFSPDHRWLVLQTNYAASSSSGQQLQSIYLYDTESGNNLTYSLVDNNFLQGRIWSNNGDWLGFLSGDFIMLSAPAADYDYLIPFDFNDCTDVAWIK